MRYVAVALRKEGERDRRTEAERRTEGATPRAALKPSPPAEGSAADETASSSGGTAPPTTNRMSRLSLSASFSNDKASP